MNIELRSIKYSAFASHETACFQAVVYIDGVKAGTVENDGQGGCDNFHPHDMQTRIDAYAATLPPAPPMFEGDDGKQTAETIVGSLLDEWLLLKDMRRAISTRIVFTRKDQKGLFQTSKCTREFLANLNEERVRKAIPHADKIINLLPIGEALQVYREAGQ